MIQGFLVHEHVTLVLLLATLVPIIKNKLGSISSSKNYRSIAISSIILKLFDWVFLLLFGCTFNLNVYSTHIRQGAPLPCVPGQHWRQLSISSSTNPKYLPVQWI